ncbi:MAG: Ig-like domain-containing protein [Bacteroidales bacterium]|nr:Ig-like domain-containing protein [Bacteroidales bacterium]
MLSIKQLFFYILTIIALFFCRCANPVSPEGGAKDVTPPKVISCTPPNLSVHFAKSAIHIDFNEFINLKNPLSEIFISPPLKHPPESKIRGRTLIIELKDSLLPATTYSISFGNAIMDITESNILKDFNYVFSTGNHIDSLTLRGNLTNAFDHKPQKDVFAELYCNNNDTLPLDSLPLHVPPYYVTKTDEFGDFSFKNVKKNNYLLFALADQNGDLIFNQPTEKIAFSDSLARPYYIPVPIHDTLRKDSLAKVKPSDLTQKKMDSLKRTDSIHKIDSIAQIEKHFPKYPLFLFESIDSIQRIVNSGFLKEGVVQLIFRFPVRQVQVLPLNLNSSVTWSVPEFSSRRDTMLIWFTHPESDSLVAEVSADGKLLDTLRLAYFKKEISKKGDKKNAHPQLELKNSVSSSGFNQFRSNFELTASYPILRWNFSRILLIEDKDTIHPKLEFTDSIKRHILLSHKWKEDKMYQLLIPDSVFFSINNLSHDTIRQTIKTKAEKDFGNFSLSLNLENHPGQYIVQLINENETTIFEEFIVTNSAKIQFPHITPGKFKVKAILDRNKNKHWDTGNYPKKIQPEMVLYFPKVIEIRGNWDVEERWDL